MKIRILGAIAVLIAVITAIYVAIVSKKRSEYFAPEKIEVGDGKSF